MKNIVEQCFIKTYIYNIIKTFLTKEHKHHKNVDGFPLFKSSKTSVWPVLCSVVNINPAKVFPLSISVGGNKPLNLIFLLDSINALNKAINEGMEFEGKRFSVSVRCIICDVQARSTSVKVAPGRPAKIPHDSLVFHWLMFVSFKVTRSFA